MGITGRTVGQLQELVASARRLDREVIELQEKAIRAADGARANIGGLVVQFLLPLLEAGGKVRLEMGHEEQGRLVLDLDQARGLAGWLNHHIGCTGKPPAAEPPLDSAGGGEPVEPQPNPDAGGAETGQSQSPGSSA